jgi:hypothetical protein
VRRAAPCGRALGDGRDEECHRTQPGHAGPEGAPRRRGVRQERRAHRSSAARLPRGRAAARPLGSLRFMRRALPPKDGGRAGWASASPRAPTLCASALGRKITPQRGWTAQGAQAPRGDWARHRSIPDRGCPEPARDQPAGVPFGRAGDPSGPSRGRLCGIGWTGYRRGVRARQRRGANRSVDPPLAMRAYSPAWSEATPAAPAPSARPHRREHHDGCVVA